MTDEAREGAFEEDPNTGEDEKQTPKPTAAELAAATRINGIESELAVERDRRVALEKSLQTLETAHAEEMEEAVTEAKRIAKAELAKALAEGDHAAAADLTEKLAELNAAEVEKDDASELEQQKAPEITPEQKATFQTWATENRSWLSKPSMSAYANGMAIEIIQEAQALGKVPPAGRILLDEVTRRVDKQFNISGRSTSDKTSGARSSGGSGSESGGKSFNDLPADAKAAFNKDATRHYGPTKKHKTLQDWQKRYTEIYFTQ